VQLWGYSELYLTLTLTLTLSPDPVPPATPRHPYAEPGGDVYVNVRSRSAREDK
jgi:hypothetical protein